jgi:hypothetical protein
MASGGNLANITKTWLVTPDAIGFPGIRGQNKGLHEVELLG